MSTIPPLVPGAPYPPTEESASGGGAGPLDDMQFLLLKQAVVRRRPVRRAAWVARKSAWTILVIGLAGWPLLFFMPSLSGLMVVAAICLVGVREYVGSGRMWRGDRTAPGFLARNQVLFLVLIAIYCIYRMLSFSPESMYSSPEMKNLMGQAAGDLQDVVEAAAPIVYYSFYFLVMVLSAILQGGLAVYYFTRRKYIDLYDRESPDWIKRVMKEVDS